MHASWIVLSWHAVVTLTRSEDQVKNLMQEGDLLNSKCSNKQNVKIFVLEVTFRM